jgi:hypothetical protein
MLTCKKYSKNLNIGNFIGKSIVPLVAFAYSCYAVYGCGQEAVLWGFILMLLGIPFYLYVKIDERNKTGIDCVDRDFLNK